MKAFPRAWERAHPPALQDSSDLASGSHRCACPVFSFGVIACPFSAHCSCTVLSSFSSCELLRTQAGNDPFPPSSHLHSAWPRSYGNGLELGSASFHRSRSLKYKIPASMAFLLPLIPSPPKICSPPVFLIF